MSIRKRDREGKPWESRLRRPDGKQVSRSFRTRKEAEKWEREQQTRMDRGEWVDPSASLITFAEYAERWMAHRPQLRPRTREVYESQLRRHVLPAFGNLSLAKITTPAIREWHVSVVATAGASTAAKCYRLLSTILRQAVDDQLLFRSPAQVRGASVENAPERPIATVAELAELIDVADERIRAFIVLGAWCSLRLSELLGLQRRHVDQMHGTVTVEQQRQELAGGGVAIVPPKTAAGRRTVTVPPPIRPIVAEHLERFAGPGADGYVFTGPKGGPMRRATLYKMWNEAKAAAGVSETLHVHDLRHTGNTLAAATGASTRELMARMGHAAPRAALIYQHATQERDEAIAAALGDLMTGAKPAPRAAVRKLM